MKTYAPQYLKLWEHPRNYAGKSWPATYSAGFGQSRDSDELEESNFAYVRKCLAALPVWDGDDSRVVVRESHWAVGWVEWIAIHQDDAAALELCDKLRKDADDYPCLDEDDLSEREQESANTIWRDCMNQKERAEWIRSHRGQFEFRGLRDAIANLRGDYFSGYPSELLS